MKPSEITVRNSAHKDRCRGQINSWLEVAVNPRSKQVVFMVSNTKKLSRNFGIQSDICIPRSMLVAIAKWFPTLTKEQRHMALEMPRWKDKRGYACVSVDDGYVCITPNPENDKDGRGTSCVHFDVTTMDEVLEWWNSEIEESLAEDE